MDDTYDEQETLPTSTSTLPSIQLNITEPPDARIDDTLKSIQAIDLAITNNSIRMLYASIPAARSISSICKLTSEFAKQIETRRKALNLPYGAESKNSPHSFFEPDD